MSFCDFCDCDDCANGREGLSHARCVSGNWICEVCYTYDVCTASDAIKVSCEVPCKNEDCIHRPRLKTGEWVKLGE